MHLNVLFFIHVFFIKVENIIADNFWRLNLNNVTRWYSSLLKINSKQVVISSKICFVSPSQSFSVTQLVQDVNLLCFQIPNYEFS